MIKFKYPKKQIEQLNHILNEYETGYINEEEYKAIIHYLFNEEVAIKIMNRIEEYIAKNVKVSPYNKKKIRLTREEMSIMNNSNSNRLLFKDFIKLVLDYQIISRDSQLRNLVKMFKAKDTNRDGIINETQFRELLQMIGLNDIDIENRLPKMLSILDSFNDNRILFSDCVGVFSKEKINDPKLGEISLLEKISNLEIQ